MMTNLTLSKKMIKAHRNELLDGSSSQSPTKPNQIMSFSLPDDKSTNFVHSTANPSKSDQISQLTAQRDSK